MKLKSIFFVFIIVFVISCATKKMPQPDNKSVNESVDKVINESNLIYTDIVMTENQIEGKKLYESNCASCHKLYDTKDFSKENWVTILKRMQPNTDLNDEQREQIYDYIAIGM